MNNKLLVYGGLYQISQADNNLFIGKVGFGIKSPTGRIHIASGTSTTPPLVIMSGQTTTTPIDGAIEYDGVHFYGSVGSTRNRLDNDSDGFLGSIYSANSWTSLSAFTNSGATVNIVSNKLQFSGGSGTYTQTLGLTRATALEYWKMIAVVSIDEITSSSFGFGLGIRSINTFGQNSVVGRAAFTTTGNTLNIDTGTNNSWANTVNSTISAVTAGTQVELSVERVRNVMYVTIRNVTTNTTPFTITTTYQFITNSGVPNTGFFSIFSFGGKFTVQSLVIDSNELKNADLLLIGDSKTVGYYATSFESRFATLLTSDFKTVVHAGGSDRTIEVLSAMTEILSLKPKQALICIGSNDPRTGVSTATYQANYLSISNQLKASGVDVYYALPFYETSQNLTSQVNFINSAFTQDKIIDTYTPMQISGALYPDGIHPSDLGNTLIYNAIIESYKLKYRNHGFKGNIGSGTTGTIPKWTGANTLGDSSITESSTLIFANKQVRFNNFFSVFNAAGGVNEKYWNFFASGPQFTFTLVDDATTTNTNYLSVTRNGTSVSSINLYGPTTISDVGTTSAISLPAVNNNSTIEIQGTTAGYLLPIHASVTADNGMAIQLINNSTTPQGYNNIYLATKGTTGANSNISFHNSGNGTIWTTGQQNSSGNFIIGVNSWFYQDFNGTNPIQCSTSGNTGIGGMSTPLAKLHLASNNGSINQVPLKFTSGNLTLVPENGAVEFDGVHFYGTIGSSRYILDNQSIVSVKPTNYNILSGDTGKYFTNEGATGATIFNLPSAAQNLQYTFIKRTNQNMTISAATGNGIHIGEVLGPSSSISTSSTANTITLVAINSSDWIATSVVGTWT